MRSPRQNRRRSRWVREWQERRRHWRRLSLWDPKFLPPGFMREHYPMGYE